MGIAVFARIPGVVQVGHHYSATVAQFLGAAYNQSTAAKRNE